MLRDFNDVLNGNEKRLGNKKSISQTYWSHQTLELYGLLDLGFEGYPFTWSTKSQEREREYPISS